MSDTTICIFCESGDHEHPAYDARVMRCGCACHGQMKRLADLCERGARQLGCRGDRSECMKFWCKALGKFLKDRGRPFPPLGDVPAFAAASDDFCKFMKEASKIGTEVPLLETN